MEKERAGLCAGGGLGYPFDGKYLMRRRKKIKKELLGKDNLLEKRIAVLGGSTTHDIIDMLELFLLDYGIRPVFFESEYAQYWQDAVFGNDRLRSLGPDVVYIHTSVRNIQEYPEITDSYQEIEKLIDETVSHFTAMWEQLKKDFGCPVIQNNFEYPYFRLLGNKDASDAHGRVNFVTRLNQRFYDYAAGHGNFFINDINYQSADYGLREWSDPLYWNMYKYSLCQDAIPVLAYNVANIIKSIFGRNKKALALDLDNTLWGGIVGEDGADNLELGQETPDGQAYTEFQKYLRQLHKQGILLNIISKNDAGNAAAGLGHPSMVLGKDDFTVIKANWDPKSTNLKQMASELSLLPESFVFVDDNPAEREIIKQQIPGAAVPQMDALEHYIDTIDRAGYFEVTSLSTDDLKRNQMYQENVKRAKLQDSFADYQEYLRSLDMEADIKPFGPPYLSRIAQLTNKSNQFNLTTKRCTEEEIRQLAGDCGYLTLYGRLEDRFGDNGVVSVAVGKISGCRLDIILWLMSCRVLKRGMESAMMDALAAQCQDRGIWAIYGHYYPTAKNAMVKDFYAQQGFTKRSENDAGDTSWELDISKGYERRNDVIRVNR